VSLGRLEDYSVNLKTVQQPSITSGSSLTSVRTDERISKSQTDSQQFLRHRVWTSGRLTCSQDDDELLHTHHDWLRLSAD